MNTNEETLSNSIAFLNQPQDGKGILFISAVKERKEKDRKGKGKNKEKKASCF